MAASESKHIKIAGTRIRTSDAAYRSNRKQTFFPVNIAYIS